MNIQVTNKEIYNKVKKVWNYGLTFKDDRVDGHLSIVYTEDGKTWTDARFGITTNEDLQNDYGFKFVDHEQGIDNMKYYF